MKVNTNSQLFCLPIICGQFPSIPLLFFVRSAHNMMKMFPDLCSVTYGWCVCIAACTKALTLINSFLCLAGNYLNVLIL